MFTTKQAVNRLVLLVVVFLLISNLNTRVIAAEKNQTKMKKLLYTKRLTKKEDAQSGDDFHKRHSRDLRPKTKGDSISKKYYPAEN